MLENQIEYETPEMGMPYVPTPEIGTGYKPRIVEQYEEFVSGLTPEQLREVEVEYGGLNGILMMPMGYTEPGKSKKKSSSKPKKKDGLVRKIVKVGAEIAVNIAKTSVQK